MSPKLTLYVNGESPLGRRAVSNIERIITEQLRGAAELIVVDVNHDPARAEQDRILATPTLVRHDPLPSRRVTGDLSDPDRVLIALELFNARK
jgi:circadian clock protein KaiB